MKTATAWFDHYAESHQDKTNKLIHWICIPIILVTTLGLMQSIPFPVSAPPWLGFGTLFAAAALVFYFRLSWTLGVGMALISAIAIGINTAIVLAGLNLPAVSASGSPSRRAPRAPRSRDLLSDTRPAAIASACVATPVAARTARSMSAVWSGPRSIM